MRTHRGLAQYTGKIFLHHFWKLKFCCSTLSTACLAATPILGFLSVTQDPHLISPLLSRLPNILRRFYSTSHTYAYLARRVNIFISSKQDSVFSAGKFRKVHSHFDNSENKITKYRLYYNPINCDNSCRGVISNKLVRIIKRKWKQKLFLYKKD